MNEFLTYAPLLIGLVLLLLQFVLLWRSRGDALDGIAREMRAQQDALERLERELRQELALNRQEAAASARGDREEQSQALDRLAQALAPGRYVVQLRRYLRR